MLLLYLSPQPICFEGKRAEQGGVGAKEERKVEMRGDDVSLRKATS